MFIDEILENKGDLTQATLSELADTLPLAKAGDRRNSQSLVLSCSMQLEKTLRAGLHSKIFQIGGTLK